MEATDQQAAGDWTSVGSVAQDPLSDEPTRFQLDRRFHDGTYAFRVFADNRAALSSPLESAWITPDVIGINSAVVMPMTNLPEIGAKIRYQKIGKGFERVSHATCNMVPNISGVSFW